jgi:hypothetical protein
MDEVLFLVLYTRLTLQLIQYLSHLLKQVPEFRVKVSRDRCMNLRSPDFSEISSERQKAGTAGFTPRQAYRDHSSLKAALEHGRLVTAIIYPDECDVHNYPLEKKSKISVALKTWWFEDRLDGEDVVIREDELIPWSKSFMHRCRDH